MSTSAGVSGACRARDDARPSTDRAAWLYAIAHNLSENSVSGLLGVGGGQVRALESGPLTAVVEWVDPRVFSADRLQSRLSDAAELEEVARRHHDVVVAVAALGPALPLRLATVYLSDDRVQSLLSQRRDEFCRTLGWLAHRTECGIKAWADPDILTRDLAPARSQPAAAGQSGAAYLLRRRAELAARAEGQRRAARCGDEIHATLGQLAISSRLHPIQDAGAADDAGQQVLNAAYLVESASFPEFAESARAVCRHAGAARVVVTGPWPAYSFADGPDALPCQHSLRAKWLPGGPSRTLLSSIFLIASWLAVSSSPATSPSRSPTSSSCGSRCAHSWSRFGPAWRSATEFSARIQRDRLA